jgi:2,4-dienoyl-CoA reductase-like NADH-dependent reductase (Old Yellow Enzyme family)
MSGHQVRFVMALGTLCQKKWDTNKLILRLGSLLGRLEELLKPALVSIVYPIIELQLTVEDFIELHGAHGYLINAFLSPLTNHRTDEYGGTFENRTKFLFRVLEAVRDAIPETVVLSLRISAVEWMEWSGQDCWTLEDSIRLAKLLPQAGVDILDVSSGGNHNDQKIDIHPYYQIDLAYQLRQAIKADGIELLIAAVGFIDNPAMAESVVHGNDAFKAVQETSGTNGKVGKGKYEDSQADLVMVGRQFLRNAGFVLTAAKELGVKVQWPLQYTKVR